MSKVICVFNFFSLIQIKQTPFQNHILSMWRVIKYHDERCLTSRGRSTEKLDISALHEIKLLMPRTRLNIATQQ